MQIKIDIEVKPEELRRFLGLPDVAGLQEDIVHFLRDKVGAASESFDPASFVKDNLQILRNSAAWRRLFTAARAGAEEEPAAAAKPRRRAARPRNPARKGAGARAGRGAAASGAGAAESAPHKAEPAGRTPAGS
ncbi:MAG: hypothetical protein ISP90_07840 [Nevskia sp.]|nr:hypothetical protein [Nevskia sp.]